MALKGIKLGVFPTSLYFLTMHEPTQSSDKALSLFLTNVQSFYSGRTNNKIIFLYRGRFTADFLPRKGNDY